MRPVNKIPLSLALTILLAPTAFAATITGTVRGPDGQLFMGAFAVAENTQNKMTVSVLSDAQGRYRIGNLPAATYKVQITAIGYASDPRTDVRLTSDEKASFDFALERLKHVSRAAASAQDHGPRPHSSGCSFHDLFSVLPLVPEAHGDANLG